MYAAGITSSSPEIKEEVRRFQADVLGELARIRRALGDGSFLFLPSRGIAKKRQGKEPRPIVLAPLASRIVQRALLDVLQGRKGIQRYLATPHSYGGIGKRGVRDAIREVVSAISGGARYCIRSDIRGFFKGIPRATVLNTIFGRVKDRGFRNLLSQATETELANMEALGAEAELFPIHEIGVAQGCCLSPLLGNILLYEFDQRMNGRGVICLRFIDDFLILARNERHAMQAFDSGATLLESLGLDAYDPRTEKEKAHMGPSSTRFEFLGCSIGPGSVLPSSKSRKRLIEKIDERLTSGLLELSRMATDPGKRRKGYIQILADVSHTIMGWTHSYRFCNPIPSMVRQLDSDVSARLHRFTTRYQYLAKGCSEDIRRRLLGVYMIGDTDFEPIPWSQPRHAKPVLTE